MSTHDPLCPVYDRPHLLLEEEGCMCKFIVQIRADEGKRLSSHGWMAPGSHEAVVATKRVRAVRHERERIAQAIEHASDVQDAIWKTAAAFTVGPGSVRAAYREAAKIARDGGPDGNG